ncbi:hypothetical protein DFQ28_004651 [Apophysomyces sp. BC1034]|nr:hypothetical protein DFQ30_005651 [Apophysomyces sp. BC1015]KAG0183069.1 hypothetical protein DFQ29_000071 [Apophysomyces sp. BC1021]KAG0193532.1 hypothetical protein DFQ28_004651 [Apophysomyces sp. BC1034]
MTDSRAYTRSTQSHNANGDTPPIPPPHDLELSVKAPVPKATRSMQRSKTVRNLENAGNKMRGLFKKQMTRDADSNKPEAAATPAREVPSASSAGTGTRPSFATASSYGPGMFQEPVMASEDSKRPLSYNVDRYEHAFRSHPDEPSMTSLPSPETDKVVPPVSQSPTSTNDKPQDDELGADSPEVEELKRELEKVNEAIERARQETTAEAERKQELQNEFEEARRNCQAREMEYTQIEHSFFEHTRAVRATDDDLSTIRDSFKLLKYSVTRMIMTLNKKADKAKATEKLVAMWPSLAVVEPNTELEPPQINLLSEKLIHEHLVHAIFRCPIYPGLPINDAFSSLSRWLVEHESKFSVRLRQQMAAIVAKSAKDSELQLAAQAEKRRIVDKIYNDVAEIYHPFILENDAVVDEEKRYSSKIADIVDKAMKLAVAMRGQEVDISMLDIEEGKEKFDEETMVDVKGKTTGIVRLCICPAFVGRDGEHGFVEKGKVVIGG